MRCVDRLVLAFSLALTSAAASAAQLVAGTGDTAANGHSTNTPYTFAIGPYNQFNPTTGGLRDIDFSFQANLFGEIQMMNTTAGTYSLSLTAKYVVDYPDGVTNLFTDENAFENEPGEFSPTGGAIFLMNGMATTDYSSNGLDTITKYATLKAFTGSGTYTLPVSADKIASVSPAPVGGYVANAAARGILTITYTYGAASNTAVTALTAIYSASAQNGTLRATITSNGSAVTGGTVYFVLTDGSGMQIGTTVIGVPTTSGLAAANFTLPAGQAIGDYTLIATYDGGTNYGLSQGVAPFYIRNNEIFANGFGVGAGGH